MSDILPDEAVTTSSPTRRCVPLPPSVRPLRLGTDLANVSAAVPPRTRTGGVYCVSEKTLKERGRKVAPAKQASAAQLIADARSRPEESDTKGLEQAASNPPPR